MGTFDIIVGAIFYIKSPLIDRPNDWREDSKTPTTVVIPATEVFELVDNGND